VNRAARALHAFNHWWAARRRFRSLKGEAIRRFQDHHGTEAARFALARSPFWQRRARGLDPRDWRDFPVIDKATVMAAFDDFNTRGMRAADATALALENERTGRTTLASNGLTVGLSSGTSGHRTISLLDAREQAGFIGFILARLFDGAPLLRRRRVAFFLRTNNAAYEEARSPFIDFRFHPLTLPEPELVRALTEQRPDVLLGPPALLGMVAALQDAKVLRIAPELVFSVAEVLEPQEREAIERAFGVAVRNVYHTSEGLLGVTCREGRLHIPEDVTAVQLEGLGGGRSTPVQTQLFRRVLPFLRYRMNDVVTLDERACPCGSEFRVLARVEGRCDDVFLLPSGPDGLRRVFPDQVRRAVLATEGIEDYRCEQAAADLIRVTVAASASMDVAGFRRALAEAMGLRGDEATIEVTRVERLPPHAGGKLVRVRRRWSPPDTGARADDPLRDEP